MNMNTLGLHPVYRPKDPSRRYKGIAVVIGLHILLIWGLVSGTAQDALKIIKKPLEAVVIQEVIIPPPPPPPPKEIKPPEAPKVEAPPPPFVPPPDVAPPDVTNAPSIAVSGCATAHTGRDCSTTTGRPHRPKPAPNRQDLRVACPTQVPPEMPRKAIQDGSEGVVKAQALVKDGAVQGRDHSVRTAGVPCSGQGGDDAVQVHGRRHGNFGDPRVCVQDRVKLHSIG
jgi:protein TonB